MADHSSLDELISRKAGEFADQLREVAALADKEEEIRIATEMQLAFIQKVAGVELVGKHEFTLARGRADSLYNLVVIEYKNPSSPGDRIGPGKDSPGAKKVVKQIQERFRALKDDHGHPLTSLFGVGFDGKHFLFVRYRDEKWDPQAPVELSQHSVERFLWALFNLGHKVKPFSPEYLAGDFGAHEGSLATRGVYALYDAIAGTDHPKALTFFNQWKILFGEVCGYDVDNPSDKVKKLAQAYGVDAAGLRPAELFFALQTYYAIFMKLLAGEIVAFFHRHRSPLKRLLAAATPAKLRREMEDLEQGSIFSKLNITNFLEGDLFAWYTNVWTEPVQKLIRDMATRLDDYNPGTLSEDPVVSRDLLKQLYQQLFPKSVRHDLGEYYTPDWLAEHVLNEVGYEGDPDKRLLDPACGSGTFLVMAINRIKRWYEANRENRPYEADELCRKILANVVGFDLNPLAVMAARTNYLIAIRDMVHLVDRVEIPVYLCDSIMTPSEYGLFAGTALGKVKELKTAAATFAIPTEIAKQREDVAKYAEQLEFCIANDYSPDEFLTRCRDEGLPISNDASHKELYGQLVDLDKANKNGVWARIIKNAFAPLFVGRVDYVVGNPPWVVWDNLPSDYRDSTKPAWERYGLFTLSASAARHGGGKKDISMLMLYVAAECYLADRGRLGFVITQTLFQTKGAGEGFRRFRLGSDGESLGVIRVDDLTSFQPFDGVSNWTSTIVLRKGEVTQWPVPYYKWSLHAGLPAADTPDWRSAFALASCTAVPIDSKKSNSPWMISSRSLEADSRLLVGPSEYQAHAGAYSGGANGVYWVRIVRAVTGAMLIQNVAEKSKRGIESVTQSIEPDLLFPLIRWADVSRFSASPSVYLVLAQDVKTRKGHPEPWMRKKCNRSRVLLHRGAWSERGAC